MLPKSHRLTKKEWDHAFISGKRYSSPLFALSYKVDPTASSNKVGISVPKKVAKSAARRNAIKRLIMDMLNDFGRNNSGIALSVVVRSFSDAEAFKKSLLESVAKIV